ncbi:GrdX family protein [Deltaproteobacteria bacterium OttesenSCG-928-K17]|nr:GrdX family protein [Deltaproteobacteria bacterium OttesenSCG-928-K17]
MSEKLILTNNPMVEIPPDQAGTQKVEGLGLAAVLLAAIDLVQAGYKLVSAPLPPNVPLIRAPYRSLILEKNDRQYDADGLKALDRALERVRTLTETRLPPGPDQANDAAFIDRDLLGRALSECLSLSQMARG